MSDNDSVTVVTHEGFLQRLMRSFGGVVAGVVLFFVSFPVLWFNEGNVVAERNALEEMQGALKKGSLKHVVAELTSTEKLSDGTFLKPGPWLKLESDVEMYQWVEKKSSETTKRTGGGADTKTTYNYVKEWSSKPIDSAKFQVPKGHANPSMPFSGTSKAVKTAKFGAYDGSAVVERLSPSETVKLSKEMLTSPSRGKIDGDHLYLGDGGKAEIGDIRVRFSSVPQGKYTVVAKPAGKSLQAHTASNGKVNFLVERGSKSEAEMIAIAKSNANTFAMVVRVIGFLMMWIGAFMVTGPLGTLLDVLPFLGSLGRAAMGLATFCVAAVLSLLTIVVGMIAHHPVALFTVIAAAVGFLGYLWHRKKAKKAMAHAVVPPSPVQAPAPAPRSQDAA